jgi:hypothetical protein
MATHFPRDSTVLNNLDYHIMCVANDLTPILFWIMWISCHQFPKEAETADATYFDLTQTVESDPIDSLREDPHNTVD